MGTPLQQLDLFGMPIDVTASNKKKKQPAIAKAKVASDKPAPTTEAITTAPTIVPTAIQSQVAATTATAIQSQAAATTAIQSQATATTATPITEPVVYANEQIVVKIKQKPIVVTKEISKEAGKRGRKSFKEIDAVADLIDIPTDETLQQKLYYSISEVAGWFKVNTSLLRYWENEFDILQPRKTRKGDRLFRIEDIKNLELIYFLLRHRKFSIEGAKSYLKNNKQKISVETQLVQSLNSFKSFLLQLKSSLNNSY